MSDTTRPENTETNQQLSLPEFEGVIPHSGKLPGEMAEYPVEDFDKTKLRFAANEGLISDIPEHPGDLPEALTIRSRIDESSEEPEAGYPDAKKRNRFLVAVGGGAIALIAAGSAIFGGSSGGDEDTLATETVEITTPDSTVDSGDIATTPETPTPTVDSRIGNVRIADAYVDGEPFITALRPNGEQIKVPRLRDTSDLNAFGESALALMACYLSTGEQECLDEFSVNEEVQATMVDLRQQLMIDQFEGLEGMASYDNFQMAIYDDPSTPAVFAWSGEPGFIVNEGGPVYFQPSDADAYQSLESSNDWYGQVTQRLEFRTETDPLGTTKIIGMRLNLVLN